MPGPIAIPQVNCSIADAHAQALRDGVPLAVPLSVYADDRGWSLMNLMQGVMGPAGQVNFSAVYPGTVKAWHRHQKQTDFWMCLQGHIRVGVLRESDGQLWQAVVGVMKPLIVIIPPTLWHGVATAGPETALMWYYVTHAYDPRQPDEERRAFDSVPGFTWQVQHR